MGGRPLMRDSQVATSLLILVMASLIPTARPLTAAAADPTISITLGPRTACVTPETTRQARADGGIVDIVLPSPNVLAANLTGTAAANAVLGCESSVSQTFHLEQEFEIAASETGIRDVALTLESTLVGLVRARHKGSAGVRLASAKICPVGWPESPLVVMHPAFVVAATGAKLCNQRLPPIKIPTMPVGLYVLVADFVLVSDAAGLTDGHSAADFSPTTTLPADWVRARDPFQGVDKKDFGFHLTLTADPVKAGLTAATAPRPTDLKLAQTTAMLPKLPAARVPRAPVLTGYGPIATRR